MAVTPELEVVRRRLRALRRQADAADAVDGPAPDDGGGFGGGDGAVPDEAGGPSAQGPGHDGRTGLHGLPPATVVPAEVDGLRACWVTSGEATDRAAMYVAGGAGGTAGPVGDRRLCARLSRALRRPVLLLDQSDPPGLPLLTRVEMTVAAARWLAGQGVDGPRTVVLGSGAGGGVGVAAALALRDAGTTLPAAVVALSPLVDLAGRGDSYRARAEVDLVWTPGELRDLAAVLAPAGDAGDGPVPGSPIDADLAGLPPVLVQVGGDEILLDDSVRLHQRLRAAGVDAVLEVWDDMPHGFQQFEDLAEAAAALDRIAAFVARHAASPPQG